MRRSAGFMDQNANTVVIDMNELNMQDIYFKVKVSFDKMGVRGGILLQINRFEKLKKFVVDYIDKFIADVQDEVAPEYFVAKGGGLFSNIILPTHGENMVEFSVHLQEHDAESNSYREDPWHLIDQMGDLARRKGLSIKKTR